MNKEQIAEMLKKEIIRIESNKNSKPNQRIVTVHLDVEVFLKMAYLFIGIHGR